MPQLEISTYLTQIFWVLLTFICFWLVMDRFIIPGIAETIDARNASTMITFLRRNG